MSRLVRSLTAARAVAVTTIALTAFAGLGSLSTLSSASVTPRSTSGPTVHRLDSISCPTSGFCMAVGTGIDHISSTDVTSAVLEYTGGSWKTAEFANPSSNATNWQTVSCSSATFCVAAGVTTKNVVAVAEYTGSWSLFRNVSITYDAHASVMQASCSGTFCFVTGYANAEVIKVSGSTVGQVALPVPAGDSTQDIGVWCHSPTDCRVTGYASGSSGTVNLEFTWDGKAFSPWSAAVDSGVIGSPLECSSTSFCVEWNALLKPNVLGVEHYNGSTWSAEATSFSGADSLAVPAGFSCLSSSWCAQVGYFYNSAMTSFLPMAYIMGGSSWKASTLPNIGHFGFLTGVGCSSSADCYAVGMYTKNTSMNGAKYVPDLLHYNGSSWSSVTVSGLG